MFRREQMEYLLNTANGIGPICIPTYKRWSREDNKALSFLELCQPDIRDNIHIFVRPEQVQAYHESFPWVHIVVLPAQIQGLASTREYICWYVLNVLHEPIFMDMDDDVTYLLYLWYDETKQFSHYSRGIEQRHSETIRLGFNLAQYVFNKAPKTVLGGLARKRFIHKPENSQRMASINQGATPRQCMFVNAKRLDEMGIHRNFMFDPTGDDIGFCAEILQHGGELFYMNCLGYEFIDDAINSVIRNDSNRRQLAAYEEQCLMQYDLGKHYLKRTFTFDDGSYKFGDIDWRAYHRFTNTKPSRIMLEELLP